MFVAIYTKDPFPESNDRIVNSPELNSMDMAEAWLRQMQRADSLNFWNPQIYNKDTGTYISSSKKD